MNVEERQVILDQLATSEARLLALVEDLTPAQWSFRERPGRWSIAENLEHVLVVEHGLTRLITEALQAPPQPEKCASAPAREPRVHAIGSDRSHKVEALEMILPRGRWPEPAQMVAELRSIRARTAQWVRELEGDLRSHFFPHGTFGDLDCYQWLIIMGRHGARHALQIEEIKADPAYPTS